uniref:N/A n=1 Tax=Ganoderma boninense TaxID=34458 RepID=A0A5K1JWG7_9APHY|nr:N/A [Ganoderma boninense]
MGVPAAVAPSVRLPPIRQIHEQPIEVLANEVEYLHRIYNPPVRGARRVDRKAFKDVLPPGAHVDENTLLLETLRTDEFERAYAVRWLTALVSRASLPLPSSPEEPSDDGEDKVDALVRAATSLIAICAGTTAARTLTRRYAFYAPSLRTDVEVSLTDVPISTDSEHYPSVGTQTWGSACVLAEMLVEEPDRFGLCPRGPEAEPEPEPEVRILELGAGTGLVSLAAAKLLSVRGARATVVASDYHPAVLGNLAQNIRANFPPGAGAGAGGLSLSAHALDWSTYQCHAAACPTLAGREPCGAAAPPFDRPFDVILGADIIYEPSHTMWIRDTVAALLPRTRIAHPVRSWAPQFHLVMPLRPTHASESRMVEEAFPSIVPGGARTELALCVLEKETIVCEAEDARGPEVEYVHYVIGWA